MSVLFQLKLVSRALRRLDDDFGVPRETRLAPLVERLRRVLTLGCLENGRCLAGDQAYVLPWTAWPTCCKRWPMKAGRVSDRLALRRLPAWMMSAPSERCRCNQRALSDFPRYPLPLRQPGVPGQDNWRTCVATAVRLAKMHLAAVRWYRPEPASRRDELDVFGDPISPAGVRTAP